MALQKAVDPGNAALPLDLFFRGRTTTGGVDSGGQRDPHTRVFGRDGNRRRVDVRVELELVVGNGELVAGLLRLSLHVDGEMLLEIGRIRGMSEGHGSNDLLQARIDR